MKTNPILLCTINLVASGILCFGQQTVNSNENGSSNSGPSDSVSKQNRESEFQAAQRLLAEALIILEPIASKENTWTNDLQSQAEAARNTISLFLAEPPSSQQGTRVLSTTVPNKEKAAMPIEEQQSTLSEKKNSTENGPSKNSESNPKQNEPAPPSSDSFEKLELDLRNLADRLTLLRRNN